MVETLKAMMILITPKLNIHYRFYSSSTVNLFEDFKLEDVTPLEEAKIKIFINVSISSYEQIVEFIKDNLINIIKLHKGNKLSINLYILQGKRSKLILSEIQRTDMIEDINYNNKLLARFNYSSKEGSRNRDPLTILYDLRGRAATVKRLCSTLQKNNVDPDAYSAIYRAAFNHLLNKGNTFSFQAININTYSIKSSSKIGPKKPHKYFCGFSDDEILKMTSKLKKSSKKTNSILSENETTLPNS